MRIMTWKDCIGVVAVASLGLVISACNTTKATVDTFAKFTSSTSPGEFITADGVVRESQKARFFAAVAYENLEQDIARGHGEYLTSLAVLLKVPEAEQGKLGALSQSQYSVLFAPERRTAERLLATLTGKQDDD